MSRFDKLEEMINMAKVNEFLGKTEKDEKKKKG